MDGASISTRISIEVHAHFLPTPVAGPQAGLVIRSLQIIDVPCWEIPDTELLYQMVRKNLYILTINIAGMRTGGTVSKLWQHHRELAEGVAGEVLAIQTWLAGQPLPSERLLVGMLEGFDGDSQHICMGRSAPVRLRRALKHAREAGIATPWMDGIAADEAASSGLQPR